AQPRLPALPDIRLTHARSDLLLEGRDTREFVDIPHLPALMIVEEFFFVGIRLIQFHHPRQIDLPRPAETVGVDAAQIQTIAGLTLMKRRLGHAGYALGSKGKSISAFQIGITQHGEGHMGAATLADDGPLEET